MRIRATGRAFLDFGEDRLAVPGISRRAPNGDPKETSSTSLKARFART